MQAQGPEGATQERARPSRPRRILVALALGLLLTLGLLEAGLWIAYGARSPRRRTEPLGEGSRTILCVGDSNTYGVHLERDESYPAQLQAFLQRSPENPWRVVNLGYPGLNSAQIRADLAAAIEDYGAEIVIAWVGTNNTWSRAASHLWETPDREGAANPLDALVQRSRVAKLARMSWNKIAGRTTAPRAVHPDALRRSLEIDWRRIHAICAERGVKLLSCDYLVHIAYNERNVHPVLRGIAQELGIPFLSLHDELLPVLYGLGYQRTMFADYHANAEGNYEVARRMLLALIEAGYLEARPEWVGVPPLWTRLDHFPIRVIESDAQRAVVLLRGRPGARYRLNLSSLYTVKDDKTVNTRVASEWYQALSREELEELGFAGQLDARGEARTELRLPPEPTEHPRHKGLEPVWLGWSLKLNLENGSGRLEIPDRDAHAVVLLDPAVVRP